VTLKRQTQYATDSQSKTDPNKKRQKAYIPSLLSCQENKRGVGGKESKALRGERRSKEESLTKAWEKRGERAQEMREETIRKNSREWSSYTLIRFGMK